MLPSPNQKSSTLCWDLDGKVSLCLWMHGFPGLGSVHKQLHDGDLELHGWLSAERG